MHTYIRIASSYAHPHMHTLICTPSYAHSHMHTLICTPSYAHPHMHTLICTPSYAHPHMHTLICTPSYAHPHMHTLIRPPSSYTCTPSSIHEGKRMVVVRGLTFLTSWFSAFQANYYEPNYLIGKHLVPISRKQCGPLELIPTHPRNR